MQPIEGRIIPKGTGGRSFRSAHAQISHKPLELMGINDLSRLLAIRRCEC